MILDFVRNRIALIFSDQTITIHNMKILDNLLIQIILGAIQIYVGLGFLEIVPGFTSGGIPGKIIGVVLLLAGIGTGVSSFIKYKSKK